MEMIERVARALSKSVYGADVSLDDWESWADQAHAAIQAMREPTEGVMKAGAKNLTGTNVAGRTYRVWQSMIDEALVSDGQSSCSAT